MSELSVESAVAERIPTPVADPATFTQVRSLHAASHASRIVKDPLGAALLRLHSQRHVLELMESTLSARAKVWAETETSTPSDHCESDSTGDILPLQPIPAESPLDSRGGADRRRFPRRQSECAVAIIDRQRASELTPQQIDWSLQSSRQVGRLLDISAAGVCLLLDGDLQIGSEVLLRISNHQLNRHVDSSATVVRSQPAGHGQASIHCVVQREFSLDQLQDLGRPQISGHVLA